MYEKDRHIRIAADWDPSAAKRLIGDLFERTEADFEKPAGWPVHPQDGELSDGGSMPMLYLGTAGIVWAQLELAAAGFGTIRNDYLEAVQAARAENVIQLNRMSFPDPDDYQVGLLGGELGFLVPLLRLDPDPQHLETILELVRQNLHNRVLEMLWGSPGSLLFLAELPETPETAQTFIDGVQFFRETLIESPSRNCRLWEQHLYGERVRLLGAVHGFAGIALAIIRAFPHLPSDDVSYWTALIRETALRTADREDGLANWRQSIDGERAGRTDWLVQICHGAPGVVACLSALMGDDPEFDELMLNGGELIWTAGPLAKGGNFCHGTAGNGWAFLKLFEATGDQLWLDRAKTFAAIAMQQVESAANTYGRYRHSLWTGDQGTALFAHACLTGDFRLPTIERF